MDKEIINFKQNNVGKQTKYRKRKICKYFTYLKNLYSISFPTECENTLIQSLLVLRSLPTQRKFIKQIR